MLTQNIGNPGSMGIMSCFDPGFLRSLSALVVQTLIKGSAYILEIFT